jgi:hypothetical protein
MTSEWRMTSIRDRLAGANADRYRAPMAAANAPIGLLLHWADHWRARQR